MYLENLRACKVAVFHSPDRVPSILSPQMANTSCALSLSIALNKRKTSVMYDEDDILCIGWEVSGFDKAKKKNKTNIRRYRSYFGASAATIVKMWSDMRSTDILDARVFEDDDIEHFFWTLHFLKNYLTESEYHAKWRSHPDEKTIRDKVWSYASRLSSLGEVKVSLQLFAISSRQNIQTLCCRFFGVMQMLMATVYILFR